MTCRIAMAGLPRAGKTSILRFLKTDEFIGKLEPKKQILESGCSIFHVADLGGQEHYSHAYWRSFLLKAHALVFVIDIDDIETLDKACQMLQKVINWNPDIRNLLILANKKDLASEIIGNVLNLLLDTLNLPSILASSRIVNFRLFTTSATTGEGLEGAFKWLSLQMTGQKDMLPVDILSARVLEKTDHPIVSSLVQGTERLTTEVTRIGIMSRHKKITRGNKLIE